MFRSFHEQQQQLEEADENALELPSRFILQQLLCQ